MEIDAPSLEGANFEGRNLQFANFQGADLRRAQFILADAREASFAGANLEGCDFYNAELQRADFTNVRAAGAVLTGAQCQASQWSGADLSHTVLDNANFTDANLTAANLEDAKLLNVYLSGANLDRVRLLATQFQLCSDLHKANGLDSLLHPGLSSIDQFTFRNSINGLPDMFLEGMGYSKDELRQLRRIHGPAVYNSCFLSHAEKDGAFADRLREDLLSHNINCWHYKHDLKGGKPWRAQISTEISKHKKLILVCSNQSLLRPNVVSEIFDAIERGRETGSQKLFPVRLDDFILGEEILQLADQKLESGEWREDWVRYVRALHIPDFNQWRKKKTYDQQFERLLRDLKG